MSMLSSFRYSFKQISRVVFALVALAGFACTGSLAAQNIDTINTSGTNNVVVSGSFAYAAAGGGGVASGLDNSCAANRLVQELQSSPKSSVSHIRISHLVAMAEREREGLSHPPEAVEPRGLNFVTASENVLQHRSKSSPPVFHRYRDELISTGLGFLAGESDFTSGCLIGIRKAVSEWAKRDAEWRVATISERDREREQWRVARSGVIEASERDFPELEVDPFVSEPFLEPDCIEVEEDMLFGGGFDSP